VKAAIAGDLTRERCGLLLLLQQRLLFLMTMMTMVAMMVVAVVTLTTVTALHGLSLPIAIVWQGSIATPILLHRRRRTPLVPEPGRDSAACPSSPHMRQILQGRTHRQGQAQTTLATTTTTTTMWGKRRQGTIYSQPGHQQRSCLL
jgi:hypothetical protein